VLEKGAGRVRKKEAPEALGRKSPTGKKKKKKTSVEFPVKGKEGAARGEKKKKKSL